MVADQFWCRQPSAPGRRDNLVPIKEKTGQRFCRLPANGLDARQQITVCSLISLCDGEALCPYFGLTQTLPGQSHCGKARI